MTTREQRGKKRKGRVIRRRGREGQENGYRNECYYKYTTTTTTTRRSMTTRGQRGKRRKGMSKTKKRASRTRKGI